MTKEEVAERLRDKEIRQKDISVNYKKSVQVFYKKKCQPSQKNCNRGPVLTNIKSVIFDYAHSRGSFAQAEEAKN